MTLIDQRKAVIIAGIVCGLLLAAVFLAGCTTTPEQPVATPAETAPAVTTAAAPAAVVTAAPTLVPTPTSTPKPVYTPSPGNVVSFTAASLQGVSPQLASDFSKEYPGSSVVFNLDGTQALKTQVENGAYADVFISASNSYTNTLTKEGYFLPGTVKPLATNVIIVILPPANTANIQSLADLAKPGIKIAMEEPSVPAGTATIAVLNNLANTTYNQAWNQSVYGNVVTYETSEPAVATKVALGEVDAGFVYQSTYAAAPSGTYQAITIPTADNYIQTYTIGILNQTTNKFAATAFENFMTTTPGQQDLAKYGFTPVIKV